MIFPISNVFLISDFRFPGLTIRSPLLIVYPRFQMIFFSLSITSPPPPPYFNKPAADKTIHFLKKSTFFPNKMRRARPL